MFPWKEFCPKSPLKENTSKVTNAFDAALSPVRLYSDNPATVSGPPKLPTSALPAGFPPVLEWKWVPVLPSEAVATENVRPGVIVLAQAAPESAMTAATTAATLTMTFIKRPKLQ